MGTAMLLKKCLANMNESISRFPSSHLDIAMEIFRLDLSIFIHCRFFHLAMLDHWMAYPWFQPP